MIIKTSEIRQKYIDFFAQRDHKLIPSSPVIPFNDPTILFINAGMNQFKDIFTGQRKVNFSRAVSCQKCIRAGGKHNDLDNVGFTARHHTFFEMLGNFSFGDYFKEQAIAYAWEFFTEDLKLSKDKLYVTVYETDNDAFELWGKIAPELKNGRILRFGKKDNYWSMGAVGPCGPCSEIHYDRGEKYGTGPEDVVNGETDRFVEIWNLVFMQYDQLPDGTVVDLPKPSVDTGAGLERLACILQNTDTNYGIDIFKSLIETIAEITSSKYEDHATTHHIIADHVRALSFAIADGAGISNEGQGYVLRRILRRAARHGRSLGMHEPFIYKLLPKLVELMGEAYPELKEKQNHIESIIKTEEEAFGRTLDTGLELFEKISEKVKGSNNNIVPGEDVFKLYDTYGFPYDLTEIIAEEHGLKLDQNGFNKAMDLQKEKSRAGASFNLATGASRAVIDEVINKLGTDGETNIIRGKLKIDSSINFANSGDGNTGAIVLSESPFYCESGGQISDIGIIFSDTFTFDVTGLEQHQNYLIHLGDFVKGSSSDANSCKAVTAEVNYERRWDIMRNHTATHLAHAALRKLLGKHISQKGSYVGPDRLRFDFSHTQPMTDDEISKIENMVNEHILTGNEVITDQMKIEDAKKSGAMALFGEKYDDEVRVVSVGDFSKELCGGTHVKYASQIGSFVITLETGIASGVRRMEAITGKEAIKYLLKAKNFRHNVASSLNRQENDDLLDAVTQLRDQNISLQKEIKKVKAEMFANASIGSIGITTQIGDITVVQHDFLETDRDTMSGWIDSQKESEKPIVAFALGIVNTKKTYIASASKAAINISGIHIGNLSKELLSSFGGRGGGKPNFAQGSVADATNPDEFFKKALSFIPEGDQ